MSCTYKLNSRIQKNPNLARKLAGLYVQRYPSRVVGRVATGLVLSGRFGSKMGIPATTGAALGDATTSIERGVDTIEGLIQAVMGGAINEFDVNGMMCGCN